MTYGQKCLKVVSAPFCMRGKRTGRRSATVQYGVVKWFDPLKGYGFIAGDDCKDVFVHQSNILMNGFRTLETGQRVRYQVDQTNKGNIAVNVVVE
jgi:CspA family cold shock protein|nr:MAG TPA: hypothetical protein [Inoviridae sp.]